MAKSRKQPTHFSAVIKALITLHEQGFIPVFNYDLLKCVNVYCVSQRRVIST